MLCNKVMNDNKFQDILKQACELRTISDKKLRKRYESLPIWHQNSLFSSNEIYKIRLTPFDERLSYSLKLKDIGNNFYNDKKYNEAINIYEQSLSIFKWIEHKNNTEDDKSWMKSTIEDDQLLYYDYIEMNRSNDEDNDDILSNFDKVKSFYISCLLNIAICYQKLGDWKLSILACDHVLLLDNENIKALYRRAVARIEPKSCGATENEMAFVDLTKAYNIITKSNALENPNNKLVVSLYHSLRLLLKEQRVKDKTNMKRLLAKSIDNKNDNNDYENKNDNTSEPNLTISEVLAKVKDMETAAKSLDFDGDKRGAKIISRKAQYVKKIVEDYSSQQENIKKHKIKSLDFSNPSNEMIEKFNGVIDLKDVRIQSILEEIHKEYLKNQELGIELSEQDQENMITMIIGQYFKSESKKMALHFISQLSSKSMKNMLKKRHESCSIHDETMRHYDSLDNDMIKDILSNYLADDINNHLYNNTTTTTNNNSSSDDDKKAAALLDMILEKYGKAFLGEEKINKFALSTLMGIVAFMLFLIWGNRGYFLKK